MRDGSTVFLPRKIRLERQHGLAAHEIGHFLLATAGMENSEDNARFMAGALVLSREDFADDVIRAKWDLHRLKTWHPNASFEMLARRLAQVERARVEIVDAGRRRVVVGPQTRREMRAFEIASGGYRRVIRVGRAD